MQTRPGMDGSGQDGWARSETSRWERERRGRDLEKAPTKLCVDLRNGSVSDSRSAWELAPRVRDAILVLHQERLAALFGLAGTATELEGATVPGPVPERSSAERRTPNFGVCSSDFVLSLWSDAASEAKGPSSR